MIISKSLLSMPNCSILSIMKLVPLSKIRFRDTVLLRIAYIIFNPDFYLIMVAAIALIKRLVLLSSTVLLIMISQLALSQDLSSPNLAADKDYQKTQRISLQKSLLKQVTLALGQL